METVEEIRVQLASLRIEFERRLLVITKEYIDRKFALPIDDHTKRRIETLEIERDIAIGDAQRSFVERAHVLYRELDKAKRRGFHARDGNSRTG